MMVPIEKEALGASSRRVVEIVEPPGGAGVASEMCAANDASEHNSGACAFACRPLNSGARRHAKSRSNFRRHLILRRHFKLSPRPGLLY